MQTRYFEFRPSPAAPVTEFWEISIFTFSYIIRTGKIGASDESRIQEFKDASDCEAAAIKEIQTVLHKGYEEVIHTANSNAIPPENAAVLGGWTEIPATAVVLGGLEGLRQCLSHGSIEQQLREIVAAKQYGQAGLDSLIPLLQHNSVRLVAAAYNVLRESAAPELHSQLVEHAPYEVFECLHKLDVNFSTLTDNQFISPDSKRLIFAFQNGKIQQFNLQTGEQISAFPGTDNWQEKTYRASVLSSDGTMLYIGRANGTLQAISLETGEVVRSFASQLPSIGRLAISADGRILVASLSSCYSDSRFEVWDVQSGKILQTCKETGGIDRIAMTPDGQRIVCKLYGILHVWDWQQNQYYSIPKWEQNSTYLPFVITPRKQTLVGFSARTLKEFNLHTGECLCTLTFPTKSSIEQFCMAPNENVGVLVDSGNAVWWNYQTGKIRRVVPCQKVGIFSPDGQFFVTRTQGGPEIWGVRSHPIKQPPLTPNESLDELLYLCSLRSQKDKNLRNTAPTEEALVRNFLQMAERHGYHLSIDDIRQRAIRRSGFSHYYYMLGETRTIPWYELNMDSPYIDVAREVPLDSPELYPF